MSLQPKLKQSVQASIFARFDPMGGGKLSAYSLLRAVYMDQVREAEAVLRASPEQINLGDPYANLTPLHVAIFRQNREIVALLVNHPRCDVWQKDNFGRTAVDMLVYTKEKQIFESIINKSYSLKLICIIHKNECMSEV
ncbi:hypothetical protein DEM27_16220 [Metarhizobium album]|uniref:Ankyrin repeat domain-containing protein n=1 Tax=Metarhizobium album TaxID=2182425 RepID=A0A2U2DNY0_9HYPH|nr:ankyrin repeat domain-containing protein [Rhizobium album]PWE55001.1 hypothetical protein DEM27_16220 [Rhizobium album]